jgi:hypothetical protein
VLDLWPNPFKLYLLLLLPTTWLKVRHSPWLRQRSQNQRNGELASSFPLRRLICHVKVMPIGFEIDLLKTRFHP